MTQPLPRLESRAPRPRKKLPRPVRWFLVLTTWILAWTFIFSAIDFWSIKLYNVCNDSWFQSYRSVMRYGVSWVSPPSFALAENAYFLWVNTYDTRYTMHEWDFYSGNPLNPDGHYNFVWGDPRTGGWMKYSMKDWYSSWTLPTIIWLVVATVLFGRREIRIPGVWVFGRVAGLVRIPQATRAD